MTPFILPHPHLRGQIKKKKIFKNNFVTNSHQARNLKLPTPWISGMGSSMVIFFWPPPHSKISIFHRPIYLYVRAHMGNRPLHISACQMQNIQDTNYSFRNLKLHIWGKPHKKIQCLYHLYWCQKTEKSEHLFYSEIVAFENAISEGCTYHVTVQKLEDIEGRQFFKIKAEIYIFHLRPRSVIWVH